MATYFTYRTKIYFFSSKLQIFQKNDSLKDKILKAYV